MESIFSLRILYVDVCAIKPIRGLDVSYSEFKKRKVHKVPIIRVFGRTPTGQSACLNIHGVFPYFMVPFAGPISDWDEVQQYLYQMAISIDNALDTATGVTNSRREHVYRIVLVQGTPYYGYHENDEVFMKIFLYSAHDIKRARELLQAGAVMNQIFQPFEAHIPYILQVFIDYNLYGMNLIHATSCWFRQSTDDSELNQSMNFEWNRCSSHTWLHARQQINTEYSNQRNPPHQCSQSCLDFILENSNRKASEGDASPHACPLHTVWTHNTIPSYAYISTDTTTKQSACQLEVDVCGKDILNRNDLSGNFKCKNPGIASLWKDEIMCRGLSYKGSHITKSQERNSYLTESERVLIGNLKMALKTSHKSSFEDEAECKRNLSVRPTDSTNYETMTQSSHLSPVVNIDIISSVVSNSFEANTEQPVSQAEVLELLCEMDIDERNETLASWKEQEDESYKMTQPWESGIELFCDITSNKIDDDNNIPQLDGVVEDTVKLNSQGFPRIAGNTSVVMKPTCQNNDERNWHKIESYSQLKQFSNQNCYNFIADMEINKLLSPVTIATNSTSRCQLTHVFTTSDDYWCAEFRHADNFMISGSANSKQNNGSTVFKVKPQPPSPYEVERFIKNLSVSHNEKETTLSSYSITDKIEPRSLSASAIDAATLLSCSQAQHLKEFTSSFSVMGLQHWRFVITQLNAIHFDLSVGHIERKMVLNEHVDSLKSEDVIKFILSVTKSTKTKLTTGIEEVVIVKPLISSPNVHEINSWILSTKKKETTSHVLSAASRPNTLPVTKNEEHKYNQSTNENPLSAKPNHKCIIQNEDTSEQSINDSCTANMSNIIGPTFENTSTSQPLHQDVRDDFVHENQHIVVMSMELHAKTRLNLKPDPQLDEIHALFYSIKTDDDAAIKPGAIMVHTCKKNEENSSVPHRGIMNLPTLYVVSEQELFKHLITFMLRADPDILLGYEIQMLSWGYLFSRAAQLDIDLCRLVSRVPSDNYHSQHNADRDAYGAENASEIHVVGRIVLNLWRLLRVEVSLYSYTFESVAYALLHERHPHYSHRTLTLWFNQLHANQSMSDHTELLRTRAIDYYMCRVIGNVRLIMKQDLVDRTSELARLFGIPFYDVLTRGTQFRVESMMLRLAHSHNFVAVSPSTTQRADMKAPECVPLVMEPEAGFYVDPLIVVDFQSLYPSIIIAYNYCFSTCIGRIGHLGRTGSFPFGCCSLNISSAILDQLLKKNSVTIAPNGVAFVKSSIRDGVLPVMLEEILNTRIMVKQSMKKCDDVATKRLLNHRQLGLKLISNVTYGYTSASFSGRMPCVEIADSIVGKARETLERAIYLVKDNYCKWNARVVYGDTDSMFICLPKHTSKFRAFEIGQEICRAVTDDNPHPIKLKLEKVYRPCVLQTKKRYVGFAYESVDQEEPIFDAKGIETVRRDGCPAVSKILENSLKTLFETRDILKVQAYVETQCGKILDGRSTIQDCTIAKEYCGAKYYKPRAMVPALVLSRKLLAVDRRAEPRIGERVPYVVVYGAPGTTLINLIRQPREVLMDSTLRLHGIYYVTKMVLPALDRVMSLLGVNVFKWYFNLPRKQQLQFCNANHNMHSMDKNLAKVTISQYFDSIYCLSCVQLSTDILCNACLSSVTMRQKSAIKLLEKVRFLERKHSRISQICINCSGSASSCSINCECMSCPVLYKCTHTKQELFKVNHRRSVLDIHDMD